MNSIHTSWKGNDPCVTSWGNAIGGLRGIFAGNQLAGIKQIGIVWSNMKVRLKGRDLTMFSLGQVLLGLLSACACLADQSGDFKYKLSDSAVCITGYMGSGGNISIPSTISNMPVTAISWTAFEGCTNISSVKISDGIRVIGERAFADCSGLTNVVVSGTVTNIMSCAFQNCGGLKDIFLPNSVTFMDWGVFYGCTNLQSIHLSDALQKIPEWAFYRCALTNIVVPDTVTTIGEIAFGECLHLKQITIPIATTNLGYCVFQTAGFESIYVVPGNPSYSSIDGVLLDHSGTILITVPPGRAGDYAIPEGITTVMEEAFMNTFRMGTLFIPQSVTNINSSAFIYSEISSYIVEQGNSEYSSVDGVLFNKSQSALLAYPSGRFGNYQIPANITSIGAFAFYANMKITEMKIPNGVTTVDECAFSLCSNLTNLVFPSSINSLSMYVLSGCENLKKFAIPDSVTNIGFGVFSQCDALESIEIPTNVTVIERDAFWNCVNLTNILIRTNVTTIGDNTFSGCKNLGCVVIPGSVTNLGDGVFSGCPNLTNLFFLGNEPSIGNGAFDQSDGVTVYHTQNALGWSDVFGSRPTALWPTISAESFSSRMVLTWSTGVLLETTNLTDGPWITNYTARSPYILEFTDTPRKFYRLKLN